MDNSQKLATQGTPDEENQNKKHNTICAGHNYAQANTINVKKKTPSAYNQLEVMTNQTWCLCGNRKDISTQNSERKYC